MGQYAPVAPPRILKELQKVDLLGTYHLVLAHDVVDNPNEYLDIFNEYIMGPATIILDNSMIELGSAVDPQMIQEAQSIIHPTFTILPDVLGDGEATYNHSLEYIKDIPEEERHKYMYVMQAKDKEELRAQCMTIELGYCSMKDCAIAIPRIMVETFGSRMSIVQNMLQISKKHIHLLGMSDNFLDDVCCARWPGVMGIDSAAPLVAGHTGDDFFIDGEVGHPGRGDFWETAEFHDDMADNVSRMRGWIGDDC